MKTVRATSRRAAHTFQWLLTIVLSLAAVTEWVGAQAPQPAGANTVVGIVTDTSGIPLQQIDVFITRLQRSTRTRADGTFRFDGIPTGTHEVRARGVGYLTPAQTVMVGKSGASLHFQMIRYGQTLAARTTVASRGGLSGIIGDTAFRPIAGLKVVAVGEPGSATTDSTSAFYMPLKPGRYLVRIDGDGFERQTIGVAIPENEGRQIAAWMVPRQGPPNHIESQSLFDFGQRKVRASPASTHFYARDELEALGVVDLLALARRWGTGQITVDCTVVLGGTATILKVEGPTAGIQVPIGQIVTADVEFVELYLPTKIGSVRGVTSLSGAATTITILPSLQPKISPECGNLTMIVWLRK